MERLFELEQAIDRAHRALEDAINAAFPVGTLVSFPNGRGRVEGTVHAPAVGDRVLIRTSRRRVWRQHYTAVWRR